MTTRFSFILSLFVCLTASAQTDTTHLSPKFVTAMEKQVAILDTAFTPATLQQCYNAIERIGNAEKKEWLPPYYMAYCLVLQSYSQETSKIDDYCDNAAKLLDRADSLSPNNSEIYVLRSMCASARIRVNPMTRGAKYGRESGEWLGKAEAADSTNPRIYLVRGTGLFYTPPAFGGGKDKAKPVLQESLDKYATFVPTSTIHPHWGKQRAQQMLDECNK